MVRCGNALPSSQTVAQVETQMLLKTYMTLDGGLGNLMFEYAFGLRLECEHGESISFVNSTLTRPESLHVFRIDRQFRFRNVPWIHKVAGKLRRIVTGIPRTIEEPSWAYDPDFIGRIRRGQQVVGFFQSPRYWPDLEQEVRRQFTFREGLSSFAWETARKIASGDSVALHVRRGDYLKLTHTHHVLTPSYYERAIDYMERETGHQARFFVFSDDLDWADAALRIPADRKCLVRNPEKGLDHEDLYLMTQCRHHIIANSSFSWWGAFLARHPDQNVAVPSRWFTPDDMNSHVSGNLYQVGWEVIPA